MISAPRGTSPMFAFSAAGFIATRTFGASPGVRMSWSAKCSWNDETPGRVPAGARISAGKFGSVERSFPKEAVSEVKRSPVSCIPSPESPANRMMTRSRRWTSFTPAGLRCSPTNVLSAPSACSAGLLTWLVTELDLLFEDAVRAWSYRRPSQDQPYVCKGRLPAAVRMMDAVLRRPDALTCHDFLPPGTSLDDAPVHCPVLETH